MEATDISEVISAWAAREPQAPAVLGDQPLTRGELQAGAAELAGRLRAAGVAPDELVGILLPRGTGLIAAVLGVLHSGAGYLPFDVATPPRRLAALAETVGLHWLVTDGRLRPAAEAIPGLTVLEIGGRVPDRLAHRPGRSHPEQLGYAIFTSGSTGTPKPVGVPRGAVANHAGAIAERYRLTEHDRVLQFANPAFDVFAEEVLPTLAAGAGVVLLSDTLPTPAELERQVARQQVSVVNLPTPYWTQWTRDLESRPRDLPRSLRLVVIGSEAGYADSLTRWRAHSDVPVINAYGLSETTVTATTAWLPPEATDLPDPLPIGQAIRGARVRVLDERMQPVPAGQPGELYLGGRLLARGYLGRPGRTAERFVPDPAEPGARLYRTGDLVRELADGGLQFLGRDDGQVKVRGHRVEPLEVAAALVRHPDLLQAHVEPLRTDGQIRLVAYLVPRDERRVPTAAAIRAHAREHLPEYLVPAVFTVLDGLPCLPNGKVDRAALPTVEAGRPASGDYRPPQTELERRLAGIWCEILGLDRVGRTDDLFELGGHSLTATRIAARIQAEEQAAVGPVEVLSMPTIERLAELVEQRRTSPQPAALPVLTGSGHRRAPLSRQQEQVWLHTSLAPDSIAYHTQTTIRVVGPLDLELFDRAITELARRHAILRTSYAQQDGELVQLVHDPEPVRADRVDLTPLPPAGRARAAEELVQRELHRRFDLGRLPLLRWTAIRLAPQEHELVLVEHHMVHDGWSFALLMRELKALYNAYARGESAGLAEPSVQYQDYAEWQRQQLDRDGSLFAGQLAYWRKQLAGMPAPLTLPPDHPRPHVQTYRGQTLRIELPPQLPAALRAFGRAHRLTLFCTMYAGFVALLHGYTGERDICIGSAYANRQLPGSQSVVGMFVNAVVQRCLVDPELPFAELARRAQQVVFEAAQHQELPFVELVRALNPQRDTAVQPMAPILFSVNDSPLPELDLAGATGTIFERGNGSAKTDLDVVVIPRAESQTADSGQQDDRILLLWEYNADLYDEHTMRQLADRYLRLLAAAVAEPDTPVGELPLADDADLRREGAPPAAGGDFRDVAGAVLARAAATPAAPAVSWAGGRLSYAELAERGRQLAGPLQAAGVARGDVVALLLPRGAELVVAELAVLLAGAVFLPLDPGTPAERVGFCCADAAVRHAITGTGDRGPLPAGVSVLAVPTGAPAPAEEPADLPPAGPADPAYLIYTSGSTGTPKGVLVGRAALANLVGWHLSALELTAADRSVLFASPAFDVSIGEIWPGLVAGASLHVPPEEARLVPDRLRDWLTEHRITVADLPTTLAEALLAMPDQPAFLRLLLTGGDRLTAAPRPGLPYALINAYGPTEATVTATWAEIGSSARLPGIGRPIPGLVARVLDGRLRPVPAGVPGELYLGGTGLALGYLNRPELTADRFGPDPYGRAGDRLYRTGDLVRRAADGSLEFLGRTDAQIKLRGYRIEPGEIAAALRRLPGIRQAHVAVLGAGGQASLVGYLVPEPGAPEPLGQAELRERLAATLPGYMVPSSYCWLETLPMTRNGKIDPARLPAPQLAEQPAGRAARRGTEQQLAEIWQQVLGVPRVGADDNFFDLGGHSLLLGRVHQRITAELRPDLPLITLFRYPTVAALARHLDAPAGTVRPADRDRPGSTQPNGRGAEPNGRADSSVGRADSSVGRAEGRDRLSRLRARR